MCMAVISFTSEKLPFFPVLKDVSYFLCVTEIQWRGIGCLMEK